jgi:hypothetical protein
MNMNMSKPATKGILFATLTALSITVLTGCGQESAPAPKVDTRTEKQKKADAIYNPTPEQKAQQAAERQARIDADLPRRIDFSDPGTADDSKYLDISETFVAYKVYNAKKAWDESPEDIAKSTMILQDTNGVDPRISTIGSKLWHARDAFEKSDLQKEQAAIVSEISQPYHDTQWVKVSLPANVASLESYDFNQKGFPVAEALFTDKLSLTDTDSKNQQYGNFKSVKPVKAYLSNIPSDYKIGFTGAADKMLINVEDEKLARKIESARPTANVEIYGYVESIQRRRLNGTDQKERFVMMHVQKIQIVDGKTGEVLVATKI